MKHVKILAAMSLAVILFGSIRARAEKFVCFSLVDLVDRGGDIVEGRITAVNQADQQCISDFTVARLSAVRPR